MLNDESVQIKKKTNLQPITLNDEKPSYWLWVEKSKIAFSHQIQLCDIT